MFANIREQKKGIFTYILVALAGIGMIFIGVPLFNTPNYKLDVAKVNDQSISQNTFNEQLTAVQKQYRDLPRSEQINRALEMVIYQTLLQDHVRHSGYTISDTRLYHLIKDRFENEELYRQALNRSSIKAVDYERAVRFEESLQNYYSIILTKALPTSDLITAQLGANLNQKRFYSVYRLAYEPILAAVKLDDEQVLKYFQEHAQQYQSKERIDVDYFVFTPKTLIKNQNVSDEEVQAALARGNDDERRAARYIIFAKDEQAAEIIASKKSFDEIYQRVKDEDSIGEAGEIPLQKNGEGQSKLIDDQLFALTMAQPTSQLIATEWGQMLLHLDKLQEATPLSEDALREHLAAQKASEQYYELAATAFDAAQKNQALEQIAVLTHQNPQTLTAVSEDELPTEWKKHPEVIKQLFGSEHLANDKTAIPVELGKEKSLFFKITQRELPAPLPFEKVQQQVEKDYRQDNANAIIDAKGAQLVSDLSANKENLEASKEKWDDVSLFKENKNINLQVNIALYNLEPKGYQSLRDANGDLLVVHLDAVKEEPQDEKLLENIAAQWQTLNWFATENAISKWLMKQAKISVNKENLPTEG